jgi:hypothetical protein
MCGCMCVCVFMYVCMCVCVFMYMCVCVCVYIYIYIQGVPGVKVNTSGFNSRADAESNTSYTRESNSQRFRSYEFLKYSK